MLLADVLDEALKKGGEFAEIYIEEKVSTSVFCEEDRIEKINSGREKGAGIRVLAEGRTSYVYTNDLSREGLLKAARVAGHAAKTRQANPIGEISWHSKPAPATLIR
jgi:TldD protein